MNTTGRHPRRCPAHRPCPHVGCRQHLALDITHTGHVRLHPALRPYGLDGAGEHLDKLPASCAVDVAMQFRGMTLEAVGEVLGLTRERVRQIEAGALDKLRDRAANDDQDEGEDDVSGLDRLASA